MSLLPKVRSLLRRCQVAQSRCDSELAQLARQDGHLQHEQEALHLQRKELKQLLVAQQAAGVMLNRGQLFALLREQAVVRRQLHTLDVQLVQTAEQRQDLLLRRDEQLLHRARWLRKEDKYQHWSHLMRQQRRIRRQQHEEAEQEEISLWKKT